MNKKLTKEVVNERIKDRGIELIDKYINSRTPVLFRCSNNHTWKTRSNNVLRGDGCPICSNSNLPLTKEIVNERIKDRGIELIDEYINNKVPVLFRCANNHEWETQPSIVLRGHGCPTCSGRLLTKEIVNERIKDRGIKLIGKFIASNPKSLFRCSNNHIWETKRSTVLFGYGCPACSNRLPLTAEIVNERIKDRGIKLIGEFITSKIPVFFRCANNHTWKTRPDDVLQGHGCPLCSATGFKNNIPAHGYLLDFGHFIKFGISNRLSSRLDRLKSYNGEFAVIKTKLFENGQDALDWENDIKKKYGGSYVTKGVFPHGFTETLPIFFKETLITMLDN
jgi:hypothetical protein